MDQFLQQFNKDKATNLTNKYKVIKTGDLAQQFVDAGYTIAMTAEQGYKKQTLNKGLGRHLIKLRHPDFKINIDGLIPEIIMRNSYNGTTCYELSIGIYRLVCANGLMAGTSFSSFKVKHVGDAMPKVLDAMKQVQESANLLEQAVKKFQGVQLTTTQVNYFAHKAVELLVPNNATNIQYLDILRTRRIEDKPTDLWTVFNKIQENALRGGLKYQIVESDLVNGQVNHVFKNNSTRAIKSLDRLVKVNRELWNIAEWLAA